MENLLFTYNLIMTIVFTIVLTGFYILRVKQDKKEYFFLTLLFIIMIADNSILYITDFSDSFIKLYDSSTLLYVVLDTIYIAFIVVGRLYIQSHFNEKISNTEKRLLIALPLIFMAATYAVNETIGEGLTYFGFYIGILYLVSKTQNALKGSAEMQKPVYRLAFISFVLLSLYGIADSALYMINMGVLIFGDFEYVYIPFVIMKILICLAGLKHLINVFALSDIGATENTKSLNDQVSEFGLVNELTPRQIEIIQLIAEGKTNKEISETLHITEGTVKAHVYNVFKKTEVTSRSQLVGKIIGDK